MLRSPAPALVVATPVRVGEEVEAGAPVLVLESMKMETVLYAPFTARVKELEVITGSQVETGAALVKLEAIGDGDDEAAAPADAGPELDLPAAEGGQSATVRAARARAALEAVVLGYDVPPRDHDAALNDYLAVREELRAESDDSVLPGEMSLLGTFADLAELSRNLPADEERHTELRVHSSREHFHTFLQSLDVERGGLPEQFRDRLLRVLHHYGVEDLERTPAMEESVFRIFLAQQRSTPEVALASAVLGHWIDEPPPTGELAGQARQLLERLGRATQLRFPVIGDLARSVRFRWFDQPAVDADRAEVLAGVRDELTALAANGGLADRAERVDALAAIPEQIVRFLAERLEDGVPAREPMLEVLARRHYREYALHGLEAIESGDRPFVVADYTLDGRPTRLVSTVGTVAELADGSDGLAASVGAHLAERGKGQEAVVDLYLHWPDAPESADAASEQLRPLVEALPFARDVRRVSVAVCAGGSRPVGYYAFRPAADGGVAEDDLTRGVHPMVGRRLNLWRLRNFDVTRIEAPEDVLLYECVARENPADRRLVALAQVRQLAVVRDEDGRVTGLPHAERAVESCLEAIRRARVARGAAGAKLDMNHVWVHVWPVVEIDESGLAALGNKIRPLTDGAGIEEVLAQGRVAVPGGDPVPVVVRFGAQPGAGVVSTVEQPPTELLAPPRRLRGQGRPVPSPRPRLPLRAERGARRPRRDPGRARPRRHRRAGRRSTAPGASTRPASSPPSSPPRRRSTPRASPASCSAVTPRSHWARSPSRSACASSPPSTSPSACRSRWSGSRCPRVPGSRWTPGPRTWTGSRRPSAGSWSSRSWAARSTWSSPASTSVPSPTGTPRRRCSCTPRASS